MKAKKKVKARARRDVTSGSGKKKTASRKDGTRVGMGRKGRGALGGTTSRGAEVQVKEQMRRETHERMVSGEARPGAGGGAAGEGDGRGTAPALPTPIATFNI
jgi:hypothetical protein